MTHTGYIMTLANSIIGVGILAMPFCFQKCGIILSIVLLVLSNLVTRVSCHYLLKSSLLTRKRSFEFLALYAFGPPGKLLVELCIIGYLIGTCIAYFVVIGDLGPQIVSKIFNIVATENLRTWIMIVVTFLCIIPLGLLKNVDSLSAVCTASVGFYFCLVVKVMFEAKTHLLSGDWMHHVDYWKPSGILQCLPIFSMALACQMQLFEVVESVNGATLEKLNEIVRLATGICTGVYIFVGLFGYVAFCTQPFSGNILVNFSPSFVSDAIKMGFVLSVAFSFPLAIFPCRASIYSLLYRRGHSDSTGYIPEARFKWITISIVVMALVTGLLIPSIELVIGLVGSTIGVAICVMFPAQCFMKVQKKESTEKMLAQFIFISGFFLMILGTYANLHAIEEKRSSGLVIDAPKITPSPELLHSENVKLDGDFQKILKTQSPEVKPNADKVDIKEVVVQERVDPMPKAPKEEDSPKVDPLPAAPNGEPVDKPNVEEKLEKKEEVVKDIDLDIKKSEKKVDIIQDEVKNEINKDAIKKEEEAVAEEEKKKENIEEIKQAKNELKQTKELLEKKVIELQQELAKQNLETQHLVQEKLGVIADKVGEIERKVNLEAENKIEKDKDVQEEKQKDETEKIEKLPSKIEPTAAAEKAIIEPNPKAQKEVIVENIPLTEDKKVSEKGPILTMLIDKLQKNASVAETPQKKEHTNNTVYEPMSYKVGEAMNQENHLVSDNLKNKNAPMPLPLFLNVTLHKSIEKKAESNKLVESDVKDTKNLKPEKLDKPSIDGNMEMKKQPEKDEKDIELENIKAIRRDILEAAPNKDDTTQPSVPSQPSSNILREKRNIVDKEFCVNWDLEKDYCRDKIVKNELLSQNNPAALGSEMKAPPFGRDLKSVDEDAD
ncbi:unnamed protein product [Hermetia illucens]|uniref:Amino acid transporter transmembrane domain-containing protein n=1 Tax=Hermetia illucens TaxID=343691 RepID=A0A7R8UC37_HERIL|nr:putative sodium-coupled neutral amino acid transporter 10 [Hermetia illucens]CAD7078035.1 unnamed protein product [Hermetia illucens]